MKETIITILITFLASVTAFAQIPNNGFENWTNLSTYDTPNDWGTINNMTSNAGVFTCMKGDPGAVGDWYLKLESKDVPGKGVMPGVAVSGIIDTLTFKPKSGFPFSQRPLKLTGSWQYMGSGSDPGFIAIYLTKWNFNTKKRDTIVETKHALTGMAMVWSKFNIDLTYLNTLLPDSAMIILSSSGPAPVEMSYLYIDNLSFEGSANGIKTIDNFDSIVSLYPNPTSSSFIIEGTSAQQKIHYTLYNIVGLEIISGDIDTNGTSFRKKMQIDGLSKGVYFINLNDGKNTCSKKISVE